MHLKLKSLRAYQLVLPIVLLVLVGLAANTAARHWRTSQLPTATDSSGSHASLPPEFAAGTWINSDPLTLKSLRGRVVLVDFWTFGCYNCRNTLPYVKAWDAKYRGKGLTIIGVHSPEFTEEKQIENVRREVAALEIRYPVVTDNDYATWKAYNVEAWPTEILLDKSGRIRWTHIGEGKYEEAEKIIQQLLAEKYDPAAKLIPQEKSRMSDKIEKSEDQWRKELSPEQYAVLREAGTERAFTGVYWDNHEKGVYYCAACGLKLFESDTKFDSGTGWPSFYAPVEGNVIKESDNSRGMLRTEVRLRRCGSKLGHGLEDGPRPTGLRYCMNSIALQFEKTK